jgi:hypothetical protein
MTPIHPPSITVDLEFTPLQFRYLLMSVRGGKGRWLHQQAALVAADVGSCYVFTGQGTFRVMPDGSAVRVVVIPEMRQTGKPLQQLASILGMSESCPELIAIEPRKTPEQFRAEMYGTFVNVPGVPEKHRARRRGQKRHSWPESGDTGNKNFRVGNHGTKYGDIGKMHLKPSPHL